MYFVNEIFASLQGEGYWTGTPMVFLRFAGCNLRCPFCDTAHTSPSTPMFLDELLKAVAEISPLASLGRNDNIRRICITGGEPGLQVDAALIDALHEAGFTIHIETTLQDGSIQKEEVQIRPGHFHYSGIVDAIITHRYPADKMSAVQNNYLADPDNQETLQEFNEMQGWRAAAKSIAKAALGE